MPWILNDPPPKFEAELAECQRYQINLIHHPDTNWQILGSGHATANNKAQIFVPLPVTMRGTTGTVIFEGNIKLQKFGDGSSSSFIPITKATVAGVASNGVYLEVEVSGVLTQGAGYNLWCANGAAQFIIDQNL